MEMGPRTYAPGMSHIGETSALRDVAVARRALLASHGRDLGTLPLDRDDGSHAPMNSVKRV